ncbi:helix-turn-helix domain-containing protein [Agromyces bauzanensis]
MSNKARDWARDLPLASASEKAVLKELGDRADLNTNECHPGLDRLAFDTALSTRTVTAALNALEAKGLISRRRRYRGYQNRISGDVFLVHVGKTIEAETKTNKPRGRPRTAAPAEAATSAANVATHAMDEEASAANIASEDAVNADPSVANLAATASVAEVANVATHEGISVATVAPAAANFAPALTEEPPENPQSSSLPSATTERASQFDGEVDEDLYLGLPRPAIDDDDDHLRVDETTDRVLRGFDQRIDPRKLLAALTRAGVDVARLNLMRAATEVWARHKGKISDPVAYLVKAIVADCDNPDWALLRSGHRPAPSTGGALTADRVCSAHGHQWVGTYDEICARCGDERPGWRDQRDAALAAEGAAAR